MTPWSSTSESSEYFLSKHSFSLLTSKGPSSCITKHYYLVVSVDNGCTLHNLCPLYHRERANAALSTLSLQALHAHWRAAKVLCSIKEFLADSYRPLRVPWSHTLLTSRPGSPSLPCQRTTGTALASLRQGHCCPCLIFPGTDNLAAKFCLTVKFCLQADSRSKLKIQENLENFIFSWQELETGFFFCLF